MFMQKELLKKLIALNCAQKPNRGLAFVNDLQMYDRLTHESWLAKMVDDIRSGNDALPLLALLPIQRQPSPSG